MNTFVEGMYLITFGLKLTYSQSQILVVVLRPGDALLLQEWMTCLLMKPSDSYKLALILKSRIHGFISYSKSSSPKAAKQTQVLTLLPPRMLKVMN